MYRDQRWSGGLVGKELCDLLVVFGDHIFMFSDKDCSFPDTGDLNVDWSRWYRRAIVKSANQVRGAERWIREYPERLFLDAACTQRFPIPLPQVDNAIFHRIVVAHGAGPRCQAAVGGSGSLFLAPNTPNESCGPFIVGRLDDGAYVHVVDDFTLDTILRTVDTVADLSQYLQRKEEFVCSGKLAFVSGEENLLAYYLRRVDSAEKHYFEVPATADAVVVDEGFWEDFVNHPDRLSQVEADEVSTLGIA